MDEIIITGNDSRLLNQFIENLCATFDTRRMGELGYFLGLEIHRTPKSLSLSQTSYATNILKKFCMTDYNPAPIPISPITRLSDLDGDALPYPTKNFSLIGALQYLTLSRPNISFAVN